MEFEATGNGCDTFSCIIIRKLHDGSINTVFSINNMQLDEIMKKYTFEFTYTGDDTDMCYLAFGYGNRMNGYRVQNVRIVDIE